MINNNIREVLQKVCAALNRYSVDYMIVGGVAVGYYGYQRISGISEARPEIKTDLDFWYNPTIENYLNLVKALGEMGVDTSKLENIVFDPKKTFLKIPHKNFHTDFLPQMAGLNSFRESKKKSTSHFLDGNELYIISYDDLILNKKAISRQIDKSDVKALERKKGKAPDLD
jgi:hypothetical protein